MAKTVRKSGNSKKIDALVLVLLSLLILFAIRPWAAFSSTANPDYAGLNLFSYFTVQSNIIAMALYLFTAYTIITGKKRSEGLSFVRGAGVLYMLVTGIVYTTLLQNNPEANPALGFDWRNFVLHQFGPLFIVTWWLLWPSPYKISAKKALYWLVFPVVWTIYTLVRAQFTDWYPYPFLNPDKAGGLLGVVAYMIGIGIGFVLLAELVAWMSRVRTANTTKL
jgi:hypothetical protein